VPLRDQLVAASLDDGRVLWTTDLPAVSAPTTGEGQVFVVADERLVSLSPDDGTIVWGFQLGGRPSAPLRWDNGWVFASTENAELFALRAADGQLQWRRGLGSAPRAPAAPAAERVFVSLEDGRVAALDLHTGETVWERPLGGTPTEIVALNDRLFVGSKDNFFYCIDVQTGKVRWRWRTGADIIGSAVVDENRVYFISLDNVLRALHRGRGGLEWHRGLPMRASSGPVMLENALIVPGVAAEFTAFAIDDGIYIGNYRAPADLAAPPHLHVKPVVEGTSPVPQPAPAPVPAGAPPSQAPQTNGDNAAGPAPSPTPQLIVITRDGGLEALERAAPGSPPATPAPSGTPAPDGVPQPAPTTTPGTEPAAPDAPVPALPAPPPTAGRLSSGPGGSDPGYEDVVAVSASSSRIAEARRLTPSAIRSMAGAENERRISRGSSSSTKNALPVT
jgi:hypothetical protein